MLQFSQQQLADRAALEKIQKKYEILRTIATNEGFYQVWFNSLPNFKSGVEAFNELNELFYQTVIPHKYKYSSYSNFLRSNRKKQ